MELIRYWEIIRKRWWLIAGLTLVVAAVTAATYDWSPAPTYAATFRLNVGLEPVPPQGAGYDYNLLDTWKASEYFMDDLASAVRGADFARRVAARMGDETLNPAGAFGASTDHRVLSVSAAWSDAEQLGLMANAAVSVLQEEGQHLVGPLGDARPELRLIDPPVVVRVGRSLKDKLDVPIRLGLALAAGIALAFLLEYLDTSVRDQGEVEDLGIRVLAQIPRRR